MARHAWKAEWERAEEKCTRLIQQHDREIADLRAQLAARDAGVGRLREAVLAAIDVCESCPEGSDYEKLEAAIDQINIAMCAALKGEG